MAQDQGQEYQSLYEWSTIIVQPEISHQILDGLPKIHGTHGETLVLVFLFPLVPSTSHFFSTYLQLPAN